MAFWRRALALFCPLEYSIDERDTRVTTESEGPRHYLLFTRKIFRRSASATDTAFFRGADLDLRVFVRVFVRVLVFFGICIYLE